MAKLSEVIANKVGIDVASELIHDGAVKVNGVIDQSDHFLYMYDVIEFGDKKLCYLGSNYLLEEEKHVH